MKNSTEDILYMRSEAGCVFIVHRVNVLRAGGCTNCVLYRMFSSFVCVMRQRGGERAWLLLTVSMLPAHWEPSSAPNHHIWALIVKMISLIEFVAECRPSQTHTPTHTHKQNPVLCLLYAGKDSLFSGIPSAIQLGLISIQLLAC